MTKYFCDACNEQVNRPLNMSVPCHLYSMKNKGQYHDSQGNRISERSDTIELCSECHNAAYSAALKAIGLPKETP